MPEKVPRLIAHVDVRQFKLDPMDGFLLTRIDGRLGPRDLARETGLPDVSVTQALEKLARLGLIEIVEPGAATPAAAPKAPPPPPPPASSPRGVAGNGFAAGLSGPKYDPKELEEPVDIGPDLKKRVLDLFYRLDDLDHYTLLGVTREVDKKGVKRAYFELAATMHPDKYFKKNLGSFKPKMEVLFGRVTEAHDTLVDPAKRAEYDAYLTEVATTRGMEAMLERALEDAKRSTESVTTAAPPLTPNTAPRASAPSADELRARKEALARRLLGGGSVRPPTASAPSGSVPPRGPRQQSSADAMDSLKRRYETRMEDATVAQAKRHVDLAEEALAKNDVVSAATALGVAVKFAPNDVALAARYQEVRNQAEAFLADSYAKQAAYEERSSHWSEAARTWKKLATVRPLDAKAHERTANAMLRSDDGDMHRAAEHAKQAVSLAPKEPANHLTLAEVYAKAGLTASAKKAAELGLQLDATHKGLLTLLKRISKP